MLLPFTRLALAAFLLYGIGYVVPLLRRDFGITESTAGFHASAIAVGTILAGFTADRFVRRLGEPLAAGIATAVVAVASLTVAFGPTVAFTLAGAALLGIGGGTLLSWVNHQLSALGGQRARVALARASVVGLLAGMAAPLAIAAVESIGFNGRLAMALPVPIVAVVEVVQRLRGVSVYVTEHPVAEGAKPATRLPWVYWRSWLVLVLVITLEFSVVFWGASVIAINTGAGTSEATTAAAAFLLGMTAARVALSAGVGTRTSRVRVAALSLLAVMIGALITWQAGSTVIAAAGLFIAGMGVGPLYPLTVAFALSLVPGNEDAGAARATLATGLALTGAPLILAVAAEQIGLVNAWPLVAVIALTAIGLVIATRRDAPPRTEFLGPNALSSPP